MIRTHYVVLMDSAGVARIFPLKQWLRENPRENLPGMHPDESTSHQLRRGLKDIGWRLEFSANEVLLIKPDDTGSTSYASSLIEEREGEEPEESSLADDEMVELTFGLERDLQSALRQNIEQLETGLRIVDGGRERTTPAGRIDIMAEDASGNLVVVELKAGIAGPRVIAQALAYMTSVAEDESRPVRGKIVAGDFAERVVLAARAVPNLALYRYTFQFTFEGVD
jgi:hypothetical protein